MEKETIQAEPVQHIAIERFVLFIYGICSIISTAVVIKCRQPVWPALMLDMSWLAGSVVHSLRFRNYRFRAFFTASLMQICLVLWSLYMGSLSMTMPVLLAVVVLHGIYGIPEIIYLAAAASTFISFYHIFFARMGYISTEYSIAQAVLEIISIYFIDFITYCMIKGRLENNEKHLSVIASLKDVERSKDDFLANVSHEIRTPINTICGMGEIILREDLSDEVRSDIFSIQNAGRSLLSIVSDVLDFSELQSGKMALVEESYNITSTINDVINMSMALKNEKRVELIVDCNANIPSGLVGDEQKIRRVIMNLLNNALKFTVEGCVSIIITSRDTDYGINLIVRVKDTGIGMKEDSLEKLFTSFNQVDTKRNRQEGGIGLGLAISQAMVDKMGGFIKIQSEFGRGSEVQFVIPQKVADSSPIASVRNPEQINLAVYINMEQFDHIEIRDEYEQLISNLTRQLKVKSRVCQKLGELKRSVEREIFSHIFISLIEYEEDIEFFDKLSENIKVIVIVERSDDMKIKNPMIKRLYKPLFILPIVMILNDEKVIQGMDENYYHRSRFTAPGTNVLAVDDNLMNIRVLEGLLRPYKIKVSMASSGAEALKKIDTMDYDLVFMDHMMPEMDGIETQHRIRQKQGNYFKKVPIVALTANAIGGMREVFLSEGFQDFMAKPIELSVLERVLRRNLPQEKLHHVEEETDSAAEDLRQHADAPVSESGSEQAGSETDMRHTDLPLECFDEQMGIRYCGGLENYISILQLTSAGGMESREKIQQCYDAKDWKDYTIHVHALKSSMMNIGVKKLSGMAKELEDAGKREDETFILEHHDAMMQEYAQILKIMEESGTLHPYAEPEEQEEHEGIAEAELDKLALEFEDAALMMDEEQMSAIAERLAACSYHGHSMKGPMDVVMRKIEMTDYMSASEAVTQLKDKLA